MGARAAPVADIVLKGGTIYDGSDRPPFVGDVAITGDRISRVGPGGPATARRVIDVRGLIVAPGFIDPHTHAEITGDAQARRLAPWLAQGVTTIVTGNDGYGTYDIAGQTRALAANPIGPNMSSYVGFGAVRTAVVGEGADAPTAAQLAAMQALVARGMCDGAIGLSTGLYYPPQKYAETAEVLALAREAGRRGGLYDTHLRDEMTVKGQLAAIDEALQIGRDAGMPVHLAHLKAPGSEWIGHGSELLAHVQAARAAGQAVTADQYPYTASGTSLIAALLPGWAQAGGIAAIKARIDDASPAGMEARTRLLAAMAENLQRRGGAENFLFTAPGRAWSGRRLDAVAKGWGIDPRDAALRIIHDDPEGAALAVFSMAEPDIATIMQAPFVVTGSDGVAGHPRIAGTFAQKYREFVVDRHVISLARFIRQSTGRTADILKLDRRGYLRPGWFADVVVFDPARYAPRADYAHPDDLAEGVTTLLVNGQLAIDGGRLGTALSGRVLRRTGVPHCPA
ncbi:MAG: amidohydrolase family protein [Sphingomonadales bacterium]